MRDRRRSSGRGRFAISASRRRGPSSSNSGETTLRPDPRRRSSASERSRNACSTAASGTRSRLPAVQRRSPERAHLDQYHGPAGPRHEPRHGRYQRCRFTGDVYPMTPSANNSNTTIRRMVERAYAPRGPRAHCSYRPETPSTLTGFPNGRRHYLACHAWRGDGLSRSPYFVKHQAALEAVQ